MSEFNKVYGESFYVLRSDVKFETFSVEGGYCSVATHIKTGTQEAGFGKSELLARIEAENKLSVSVLENNCLGKT